MKRQVVALIALLGLFGLACGLLDDDATTVTYHPTIPLEYTVDANEWCDSGDFDCEEEQEPAPQDIGLAHVEHGDDVDLAELIAEAYDEDEDDIRDMAGQLRTLEITSIRYKVEDNDLTFDVPDIELHVGPLGMEDSDDEDAIYLTTIPSTDAGTDADGTAEVSEEDREASSELFKQLEFAAVAGLEPKIREGQYVPPSGDAEVEVTIDLRIQANPRDGL